MQNSDWRKINRLLQGNRKGSRLLNATHMVMYQEDRFASTVPTDFAVQFSGLVQGC